jgi:hypothetical protein
MIRIICLILLLLPTNLLAASFHWVDSQGFHSVDQVTKVPLEQRLELPMAKNRIALPFTEEEDLDGAMYVWFILNQSGIRVPYASAAVFSKSPFFTRVDQPQNGDIAWWKGFTAIVALKPGVVLRTATGELALKALEKKYGKAGWYRYAGNTDAQAAVQPAVAPQSVLKNADKFLQQLDKTAEYPLQVKDPLEIEKLKQIWTKAIANLENLRKKYPDDPQISRRLGVNYRRGFTLEMPGAWERAEAYLLRTTSLAPQSADAFISLGILYGDTGEGLEGQSELQFRNALQIARKEQLPYIWWGLAIALHKQGKKGEALKTIDLLLKQRPKDAKALKLREEFLKPGTGKTE